MNGSDLETNHGRIGWRVEERGRSRLCRAASKSEEWYERLRGLSVPREVYFLSLSMIMIARWPA
jgi:hypothetical protein